MKKILSFLIPCLLMSGLSFAQVSTKFSVNLVTPAAGSTIVNGTAFTQQFVITVTQGSVTASDTMGWADPFGIWRSNRVLTKNTGDTIIVNVPYTIASSDTGQGNTNYCVTAYLRLPGPVIAPNFDTTGGTNRSCNNVTKFFATSTNDISSKTGPQKLNVYPNPAVGNIINLDYVALNSSEVKAIIRDLSGRTILTHSYGKAAKGQEGFELDISALTKGIYLIELRQDNVKMTGRFVK